MAKRIYIGNGKYCYTENCRIHNSRTALEIATSEGTVEDFLQQKEEAVNAVRVSPVFNNPLYRNVQKMSALFKIDRENHVGTEEINPASEWIFHDETITTVKRDGTGITVLDDGRVYARRSVRKGKTPPAGFILAEVDSFTGHSFGIEPIEQSGFRKAYKEATADGADLAPGTYELCGPKVNNNPEKFDSHKLIKHGSEIAEDIPDMRAVSKDKAYSVLKEIFEGYKDRGIEGVVWWASDGRRVKLRAKDFFPELDSRHFRK